jgi:hypothetical protein
VTSSAASIVRALARIVSQRDGIDDLNSQTTPQPLMFCARQGPHDRDHLLLNFGRRVTHRRFVMGDPGADLPNLIRAAEQA